ncbi:hypothetical protein P691DRAFT_808789 [Macrolepiota fuliginosa MF-IS2]|uniref:DUF6533 domain-containing protein n=1 Tax=Macrolepiota fuliginosa MF-IS2 TaxID=1400762 RepID=A0A9P6C4C8_9AGAR|nr:hypothetical protein P691DRAFT_808789 [Macrolepiota fuliginosa MF-IS2]
MSAEVSPLSVDKGSVQEARAIAYGYVAAITIVVYDVILLSREEIEYIYRGRWSLVKLLYILIRFFALVDFSFSEKLTFDYPSLAALNVGISQQSLTHFLPSARYVGYTWVIETLLFLRLRALYSNNMIVTGMLSFVIFRELFIQATTYVFLLVGISTQVHGIVVSPTPGCMPQISSDILGPENQGMANIWVTHLLSNTIEVALTLFKLYRSLKVERGSLLSKLGQMKGWRPVLYVFYRDGTLFSIPMFILSIGGLLGTLGYMQSLGLTTSWSM